MKKSFIRHFNANAIFHRIRIEPNVSQRDIATKTGIDKSVVSSIINQFSELGLVERNPVASGNKPGRPMEGLVISPESGLIVGVQIEADTIGYVAAALDGIPLCSRAQAFDGKLGGVVDLVARGINEIVGECARKGDTLGVGISVPGLLTDEGVLLHAPVLGWRGVPVVDMFASALEAPVFAGNDGKAAAMAEYMFGECVDVKDFIYLFSGSGVGGALFLDGDIYRGATGLAGELGHIKVVPQGRYCSCGASGCLSAYLSEPALADEIGRLTGKLPSSFNEIIERARAGDEAVIGVLDNAGAVLGSAISSLVNIFNPPLVCLGGDMASAEPYLRPAVERALQRLAHPSMSVQTKVIFSQLSTVSPFLGGVALALDGVTGLDSPHVLP
ncbi:ROK family transcriptional regulator [Mesorhizobium sp.]|uniref:ROK family transcriptional regulator n=1 Tax=Mesorhizobium sp. TaxID=1871066 RepID=UPI0012263419|nr:ROK family transcriptional regulator [Mesorhizobium sp.]TIO10857.1 MAG: ROK family transcriptional regulator [Mesorhizobium sp.]TIO35199.1 MAG: ROK family transcriptional regulator [Mesorhizobium sp.]